MSRFTYSPIVELRMYALHPGRRDELIRLFEREFIESQEAVGIQVIGQFYDLDDPNRFIWLRGFHDMPARAESLQAFYGGPIWKAHRDAANATMIDSDNVLLLHLPHGACGFSLKDANRPPLGSRAKQDGFVTATIYYVNEPVAWEVAQNRMDLLQPRSIMLMSLWTLISSDTLRTRSNPCSLSLVHPSSPISSQRTAQIHFLHCPCGKASMFLSGSQVFQIRMLIKLNSPGLESQNSGRRKSRTF